MEERKDHLWKVAQEVEDRLDEMDRLQREEYPSLHGQTRLAVFPELQHSGRAYSVAWEERSWDLRRAQEYLAGCVAVRQANQQGQVSIYARRYAVGARHRGETIVVQYDADEQVWLLSDVDGKVLRTADAPEISRERIRALNISAS